MAYRNETEPGGIKALVIDGWENGIADSPYLGIASMKNVNCSWLPGATYVNYKRKPVTLSGTMGIPKFYTQSPGTSPTYYILDDKGQVWVSSSSSSWALLTGNHTASSGLGYGIAYYKDYLFVFGTNYVDVCGNGTGPGGITSSNWANNGSSGYYFINISGRSIASAPIAPTNATFTAAPAVAAVSGTLSSNWSGTTGTYLITFSDGEQSYGVFTNSSTAVTWTTPLANAVTTAIVVSSPTLTLSSAWDYPSGIYQVVLGAGLQTVQGTFINGQTSISIVPGVSISTMSTTIDIRLFTNTSPVNHMALVAINDVLYFCNGNTIGSISVPPYNLAAVFKTSDFSTQYVGFSSLTLRTTDRAVWLTELNQNLLIAVKDYIYAWDKTTTLVAGFPTQVFTAAPINEQPSRMINILNNVYIFAGQKGNIYLSNGYSVSLFKKMPDSFLGVIDPYWVIGGMMFHRNKLWFGAVVSDYGGSNYIQGIFSLTLVGGSATNSLETAGAITMESQNSNTTLTSGADGTGILIDLTSYYGNGYGNGITFDTYQSAWYSGSAGGIDYNDQTLWANHEPVIETDLIPTGTYLQPHTFERIEFKLDRPLLNGDEIKMYYRTSFTASYNLIGTSTATSTFLPLSDNFNSNINRVQWVQFKITFKCASTSSFIPLREIRIH